jgi:hypothetical protein
MLLPLMTLISANISDIINWPEKNVGVAAKIFKNDFPVIDGRSLVRKNNTYLLWKWNLELLSKSIR